jgi:hypothetical protein
MANLKNYGIRTLVGNWFEERVTVNAYLGQHAVPKEVKDLDIDVHVSVKDENPGMLMDAPSVTQSSYSYATLPALLEQRNRVRSQLQTVESRRRLTGTTSLSTSALPGATLTPSLLPKQFHDPNKTRYSSCYRKHYARPEFEAIRGLSRRDMSSVPRITALTETWDPTWQA